MTTADLRQPAGQGPAALVEFFGALGFTFDPQFTDENATCMIIAENIFAMLLVEPFFDELHQQAGRGRAQDRRSVLALSGGQPRGRGRAVDKAIAAGAGDTPSRRRTTAFMYQRGFEDLDGHLWEVFHMSAPPPQLQAHARDLHRRSAMVDRRAMSDAAIADGGSHDGIARDVRRAVDAVWRIESARLIAGLARMLRDVGLAEELAQDALVAALETLAARRACRTIPAPG